MSRDPERMQETPVDEEAEQEVDLSRYWRLLLSRWWLVAAGVVLGAIVGYAFALGGSGGYKASATLYLGQPYSVGGGSPIQTLQTNPSTLNAILESVSVVHRVAAECKVDASSFRNGITSEEVASNIVRNNLSPIVRITVQSKHAKIAVCAANGLARDTMQRIGGFAQRKIQNFQSRIRNDEQSIQTIKAGIASTQVSTTDKLLFQLQLRNFQEDQISANQLLLQVEQVEAPQLLTPAASKHAQSVSRRNAISIAAVIGLVLGVLLALVWDRVVPRFSSPKA